MSLASRTRALLPLRVQPFARYHYERWRGLLERELPLLCAAIAPGDRVIDVGANVGVYTYALRRRGAIVEAFEPQPGCHDVLGAYASADSGVRLHPTALGAGRARATLRIPRVDGRLASGAASLVKDEENAEAESVDVEVRPLDSYEFDAVRAIKIDVEGAELGVLQGARETLARHKPLLLVEIEQRHHTDPIDRIFDAVLRMGYRGEFVLPGRGIMPLSEFKVDLHQRAPTREERRAYVNNFFFRPV